MKLTQIKWKDLRALENIAADAYSNDREAFVQLTACELLMILYDVRRYKEMMREYDRFFRQHKIQSFGELARRFAEIQNGKKTQ